MRKLWIALAAALAAPSIAQAQGTAYAFDHRGADIFFSFPVDDPLNDQVLINFPLDYSTFAMDFSTDGKTLFAVSHYDTTGDGNNDTLRVGTIDIGNGSFTVNADVSIDPLVDGIETGLSVDPTDETLYFSTGSSLYTLDSDSGSATLIGDYTGTDGNGNPMGLVIDISIDNDGNMFAHDIGTDALFAIDKATAEGTFIGFSGLAANFAQGMDFDPTTNTLYAAIYTGGGTGVYGTWDTTTGEVTEIVDGLSFTDPEGGEVEMEIAIQAGEAPVCPGDCNGDGNLSVLDFVCFQGEWQNQTDFGDCNNDGQYSVLDFVCYQGLFQQGCP